MAKAIAIEHQKSDDELLPCVIHPMAKARIRDHLLVCELLIDIAMHAATDSGIELVRLQIFPDFSHEYNASEILVFEAVIRASDGGRDAFWDAIEHRLSMSLAQLPKKERTFFAQKISFEVSDK